MAYDRYDTRRGPRDERSRWSEDRFESRDRGGFRGGPDRDPRSDRDRDERGFFERAGEQIASWFGDEDDDRRDRQADEFRGGRSSWSGDRDFRSGGREPWGGGDRGGSDSYRPMTGDYSRSEGLFAASGYGRGDEPRGSRSNWDRDDYRRTSFAGSSARSQHHDPHYHEWRQRQIEELDRDYDEYRREHQSKFENDFGSWRQQRQTKRQMLGSAREQMEVVGSDGEHVGTIDKVAGDRIILTKSDPEAGGVHHSLSCTDIDRIEGDRLILGCSSAEAKTRWREEGGNRALFERDGGRDERSREDGPHMLDRSFSGTYRDRD